MSSAVATNTIGLFLEKSPFSTTPTIPFILSSMAATSIGVSQVQSRIWLPLSVITGPALRTPSRRTHFAPRALSAFVTGSRAASIISTGTGNFVPIVSTALEESATTTKTSEFYSTIFSRT